MSRTFSIFYNSFFDSQPGHLNPDLDRLLKKFQKILPEIKWYLLSEADWLHEKLHKEIRELIDLYHLSGVKNDKFIEFLNGIYSEFSLSKTDTNDSICTDLWNDQVVSAGTMKIPNMLHEESYKYYKWLGVTWKGPGSIVELGCWMGATTSCIAEGLLENKAQHKKEIYVYDSFQWSTSMLMFQSFRKLKNAKLSEGDCFLDLFKNYCAQYLDRINISKSYLYTNENTPRSLPELSWDGGEVDILIWDLPSSRAIDAAVWEIFSPHFVPEKTLLVFNQFGNLSANGLRQFIRDHSNDLRAVHKPNSAIKTFLYTGPCEGTKDTESTMRDVDSQLNHL